MINGADVTMIVIASIMLLFVFREGKRLDRLIASMGYTKEIADDSRRMLESVVKDHAMVSEHIAAALRSIADAVRDGTARHSQETFRLEQSMTDLHRRMDHWYAKTGVETSHADE